MEEKTKRKCYGHFIVLLFLVCSMWMSLPVLAATPTAAHGRLSVSGTLLKDKNGSYFQVKGVSTHGIQWFPQYVDKSAFKTLRDDFGVNTVRLAAYVREYNGYTTGGQAQMDTLIEQGVQYATDLGMYVIIDWHILNDNPNTYVKQAKVFFEKYAKKYQGYSNVLYEICNEPVNTQWYNGSSKDLYTYAGKIIPIIRKYTDAVILVGTNTWSQDVDEVAGKPLKASNVMYTLHFYAGTHGSWLRDKAQKALDAGIPLFVSEFGICDASGNGNINKTEANQWISWLNKKKIGYVNWSLCNKGESASMLKSSCSKVSGWSNTDLTTSGKWLKETYTGKKLSQTTAAKPGKVTVKSVTPGKKYLKATWKKVSGASGYEVKVASNKKFTKNVKIFTAKGTTKKLNGLKKKTKYYVKIRAYKTVNGKKVTGSYSNIKTGRCL